MKKQPIKVSSNELECCRREYESIAETSARRRRAARRSRSCASGGVVGVKENHDRLGRVAAAVLNAAETALSR